MLQSELWYYDNTDIEDDKSAFPGPIRRIVARPKTEQDEVKYIPVASTDENVSVAALHAAIVNAKT